ncbi:hypothetical protein Y032_0105g3667 [Ancylostoma ceylanicum]|uniref:Uncharacterized protein n=1 Tax=Ancylostoma ceylanicum TaxID=53326 RepID=A0A016TG57_9BILA|nr:hypothetical protein Y032_0105g3667 [Ancylostoma ceylanicum]
MVTPWTETIEKTLKKVPQETVPIDQFWYAVCTFAAAVFHITLYGAPTCCLVWCRRKKSFLKDCTVRLMRMVSGRVR